MYRSKCEEIAQEMWFAIEASPFQSRLLKYRLGIIKIPYGIFGPANFQKGAVLG